MKPISALVGVLALALTSASACAQMPPPVVLPIVRAQNQFAFELFAQLRQQEGNLFVSPSSLYNALGMVLLGSKGQTEAQLADVLHVARFDHRIQGRGLREAFGHAVAGFKPYGTRPAEDFQVHSADAVWVRRHDRIEPSYVAAIRQDFDGQSGQVDFADPAAASDRINRWVAAHTAGEITRLIQPGAIRPSTRLILTNAAFFKARWYYVFNRSRTKPMKFHVSSRQSVIVPMMKKEYDFSLARIDHLKVLTLSYDGPASMDIILPDDAAQLPSIEAGFTAAKLDRWLAMQKYQPVIVALPRFQTRGDLALKPALMRLGMAEVFSSSANLTGIANDAQAPLTLGAIVQQNFITVDEKGTKAMAATGLEAVSASAPYPGAPPPPRFIADHPFFYVIRADPSGTILFMGRMSDPAVP